LGKEGGRKEKKRGIGDVALRFVWFALKRGEADPTLYITLRAIKRREGGGKRKKIGERERKS